MTPLAIRRAAEDIANEVGTAVDARRRGAELGRSLASQIRQCGTTTRLVHGFGMVDLELALLHVASTRERMLAEVAFSALSTFRQERERARQERERARRQSQEGFAIDAAQCRQARELLGWSQRDLAERARLSKTYVNYFERWEAMPGKFALQQERVQAIRDALEADGVAFAGGGAPVLMLGNSEE